MKDERIENCLCENREREPERCSEMIFYEECTTDCRYNYTTYRRKASRTSFLLIRDSRFAIRDSVQRKFCSILSVSSKFNFSSLTSHVFFIHQSLLRAYKLIWLTHKYTAAVSSRDGLGSTISARASRCHLQYPKVTEVMLPSDRASWSEII